MRLSCGLALLCISISGCSTSHIIVGKLHPRIDPSQVVVYMDPPQRYEKVAIISSDSNFSLRFGAQGKINAALNRAKVDAAKLGANGLLLQSTGSEGGVVVGNGFTTTTGTTSSGTFVGTSSGGLIKTVSVIAIYVPPS